MKYSFILLSLLFLWANDTIIAQEEKEDLLYIQWFGDDDVANHLTHMGIKHFMNIEREKAYTYFEAAIAQDPSLFAPHVALAWMSKGDKKSYHKVQAQNLVKGKNEVSRTFVSLLSIPKGESAPEQRRQAWAKMHELGHDGRFIHFQYALSLENTEDVIAELKNLKAKNKADGDDVAHIHNILGYMYYELGNKEKSKAHFEKYVALYPEGYNAYDSMGEFYYNEGDLEKAKSYYAKAKEQYPAAVSATNMLKQIEGEMMDKGNLVEVTTEYVAPEDMGDYVKWGQEYKAIADQADFRNFYVSMSEGSFSYAHIPGKSLADVEKVDKEWDEWHKNTPALQELYDKYKHTVKATEKKLWRHSPKFSYEPESYTNLENPTYVRVYQGHVKFGHGKEVKAILDEFKSTWAEAGISYPYNVYWNVYGEKGPCVVIRSVYKDADDWLAERKEVSEKIDKAKLDDIVNRWNSHMRKWEAHESFPRADMTHIKGQPLAAAND